MNFTCHFPDSAGATSSVGPAPTSQEAQVAVLPYVHHVDHHVADLFAVVNGRFLFT